MASAYFRNFAIEHGLTVDYGYMYGKYKDFYISLKESLGSTKTLYIITKLGDNVENLKEVLSVYDEEELPKYCITNMKREPNYLEFTFELTTANCGLIVEFLDKFIESYRYRGLDVSTYCPICNEKINSDEKVAIIDISGILTPTHDSCYEKGKEQAKAKAKERQQEVNKDSKGYLNGLAGALVYSLIYVAILIGLFCFIQFVISNNTTGGNFILLLQYAPVLVCLAACPLIYAGYDAFKGTKGTTKYIVILWCVIISTLLGTFFGFVVSLLIAVPGVSFIELLELVGQLITCKDISGSTSFRWGFYVYIVVGMLLSILSMVFKFSGKQAMDEANQGTFEKLD